MLPWLKKHTFQVHTIALIVMIIAAVLLFLAASHSLIWGIWFLLAIIILANFSILAVK
jgi:hypothetical protein